MPSLIKKLFSKRLAALATVLGCAAVAFAWTNPFFLETLDLQACKEALSRWTASRSNGDKVATQLISLSPEAEAITEGPTEGPSSDEFEQEPVTYVQALALSPVTETYVDRSFTGLLVARRASDLGFKRLGQVVNVYVDHGDVVDQGMLLAELDTSELLAEQSVIKAQRDASLAKLDELLAGPRQQSIEASRARTAELKALRDQALMTYQRRQRLAGSDAIAYQELDDARLQLAASEGRLAAQMQVLNELEEGTRKEQIAAQRAMVKELDANIERINVQLAESQLRAPFNAIVAKRMTDEGTVIAPGTPILRIVERDSPEAWIGVPPDLASTLSRDEECKLTVLDQPRRGRVISVLPELDATTRTQTVVIGLSELEATESTDNADADKLAQETGYPALGQIVQLHLRQKTEQEGFWLPLSALTQGIKGLWSAYVLVPADDSRPSVQEYVVRRSDLEVIQITSSHVLVRGTLQEGDRIVATGLQKLTPGQRVQLSGPAIDSNDISRHVKERSDGTAKGSS